MASVGPYAMLNHMTCIGGILEKPDVGTHNAALLPPKWTICPALCDRIPVCRAPTGEKRRPSRPLGPSGHGGDLGLGLALDGRMRHQR